MITNQQTTKEYFNSLLFIYFALIGGQVIFGLITFYLINNTNYEPNAKDLKNIFIYIIPVFILYGVVAGNIFYKKNINSSKKKKTIIEKLNGYRTALIIKYALLEGSSFFSLVSYLATGEAIFLYFSIFIIAVFIVYKPSLEKIGSELELNIFEKHILEDLNAIIKE